MYEHNRGEATTVVIVVLVLIVLTALGWIFWQNFIHKETTKTETDLIIVDKSKDGVKKDETPVASESVLSLSKYGVEIPLGGVTTKYTAVYETYDGGDHYEIRTQIGGCGTVGTGAIVREGKTGETTPYKPGEMRGDWSNRTWGDLAADSRYSDRFVVVDGEVYSYIHPQNVMCDGEEQNQEVAATKLVQSTLFKRLRSIK